MKKILSLTFIFSLLLFTAQNNYAVSQDQEMEVVEATEIQEAEVAPEPQSVGFTQELKNRFIEGGPGFMGIVLACLILGLAIAIERIIYLNFATTNTEKLTADVESALKSGGVEAAKEVCRNTPGPVASIFYQGLDRAGVKVLKVLKRQLLHMEEYKWDNWKKMFHGFHYLLLLLQCLVSWVQLLV